RSLARFVDLDAELHLGSDSIARLNDALAAVGRALAAAIPTTQSRAAAQDARVPVRNVAVKGPLAPTGDWVREKAGAAGADVAVAVARLQNSDDVTYEIVNFVDGPRTVSEIRNAVSAEFAPIDVKVVAEYLDLLARIGAVTFKR